MKQTLHSSEVIIGIDACRIRSGGGVAHLVGIFKEGDPLKHGINKIHIWSYKQLLDKLPDKPWLVKHNPAQLEKSLVNQLWWQFQILPKEARKVGCDLMFTTDASSICNFRPSVVLSQDMLSYEPGQMKHYGVSLKRLRLIAIKIIQNRAMKRADGVVFLTNYAAQVLQQATGKLRRIAVIPHGIGEIFRQSALNRDWPVDNRKEIKCIYVSNAAMYKHQWVVVRAIGELREYGHNVNLLLVGGGSGRAKKLMDKAIAETDSNGKFIHCKEFVKHDDIPKLLAKADIFIFASSCENMPNTLLEAMAGGLPIACSERGPMPEVLQDGGVFFDPESSKSISQAIKTIIEDDGLRIRVAHRAKELSRQYTWSRCADETWSFIRSTVNTERN
jgi:glycosyltransferase involved in cell wall biosynthesis